MSKEEQKANSQKAEAEETNRTKTTEEEEDEQNETTTALISQEVEALRLDEKKTIDEKIQVSEAQAEVRIWIL